MGKHVSNLPAMVARFKSSLEKDHEGVLDLIS